MRLLYDTHFWINYLNTFVYTVLGTAIAMALTTTFAYALSKKRLKGRAMFIGIAVFTMFFNGGLIPNYILINTLGKIGRASCRERLAIDGGDRPLENTDSRDVMVHGREQRA